MSQFSIWAALTSQQVSVPVPLLHYISEREVETTVYFLLLVPLHFTYQIFIRQSQLRGFHKERFRFPGEIWEFFCFSLFPWMDSYRLIQT